MSHSSRVPASPHKSASSSNIIVQPEPPGPLLQHTNSDPSTNPAGRITAFLSESSKGTHQQHHAHVQLPTAGLGSGTGKDALALKNPSPREASEANGSGGRGTPRHADGNKSERHTPREHPGAHQKVLTPRKQGPIVDKAKGTSPSNTYGAAIPAPVPASAPMPVPVASDEPTATASSPVAAVQGSRVRRGSLSLPNVANTTVVTAGPLSPSKPPAAPPLQLAAANASDEFSITSRSSIGGAPKSGKPRASQGLSLSTGAAVGTLVGSAGPASSRGSGAGTPELSEEAGSPRRGFASPLRRSVAPAARGAALQHELGLYGAFRARERELARQINANTPFQYLDASPEELQRASASPRGSVLQPPLPLPSSRPVEAASSAKPDATAFSKWHLEMDERVAQRKAQVQAALAQTKRTTKYVSMPVQQRLSRRGLDQLAVGESTSSSSVNSVVPASASGSNLNVAATPAIAPSTSSTTLSRDSNSGDKPTAVASSGSLKK